MVDGFFFVRLDYSPSLYCQPHTKFTHAVIPICSLYFTQSDSTFIGGYGEWERARTQVTSLYEKYNLSA